MASRNTIGFRVPVSHLWSRPLKGLHHDDHDDQDDHDDHDEHDEHLDLDGNVGVAAVEDDEGPVEDEDEGLHHDDHDEHLLPELLDDSLAGHVGMFASIPDIVEE